MQIWRWGARWGRFDIFDLELCFLSAALMKRLPSSEIKTLCKNFSPPCQTASGGSEGLGIHRTYPYPAYGGLAPVPGGQGSNGTTSQISVTYSVTGVGKGF